ncbi:MAG TPA: hypothetical protein GXX18_03880 [Bacillales bacterium]|nr:hypothetical protein [Bacillales bacterium]
MLGIIKVLIVIVKREKLVSSYDNKLGGIYGSFAQANQKGICLLCNGLGEVGMFFAEINREGLGDVHQTGSCHGLIVDNWYLSSPNRG